MKICVLGAGTAGLVTALMLREKYPFRSITVVKSGDIGIVGVGEGSTEHWARFMDYIGLSIEEVVFNTRATIKTGILFKDWSSKGSEYVHSLSDDPFSKHGRMDFFHQLWIEDKNKSKFPLSPLFENVFYKNNVPLFPDFKVSNQYHFDTYKLNAYLLKICLERNISVIDTVVIDTVLCSVSGDITELVSEKGNIKAELFIDSSGFKRILSKKLNNKWVSKTEYLPMNHAIAFPTEHNNTEIEPYTTTTALSSGWAWKIPTQDRYGNGYVFNDTFINTDEALSEINNLLGINVEKTAKDIKFEAGKMDKFWCKNVISTGLCGSFAEPLEAQSIGFTIVQAFALLDHLDGWCVDRVFSEKYNTSMDEVFDNIIDYLQMHYFVERRDTKFWQESPFTITAFNKDTQKLFRLGIIDHTSFKKNPYMMFASPNWYQVMHGLSLIDKKHLQYKAADTRYNTEVNQQIKDQVKNAVRVSKSMPVWSHTDYLKYVEISFNTKYAGLV